MENEKIGIIGSGLIGRSWAMLFASIGYQVMLYDILPLQLEEALQEITINLKEFQMKNILRGHLTAVEQLRCISSTTDLKVLVNKAIFIQECIPENLEMKMALYQQLDNIIDVNSIVSSSTSTLMPSLFSKDMTHKEQVLVSHPLNPPYHLPLVEIVPAPWTSSQAIELTKSLMLAIGQKPVVLQREIQGFASNRLQYALLNEAWRLVADGIISVKDVDMVMTDGLGLRYAFLGPLQTAHLNAEGIENYIQRYGKEMQTVSQSFGPPPNYDERTTLKEIAMKCEEIVPHTELSMQRLRRDSFLVALNNLKRNMNFN